MGDMNTVSASRGLSGEALHWLGLRTPPEAPRARKRTPRVVRVAAPNQAEPRQHFR